MQNTSSNPYPATHVFYLLEVYYNDIPVGTVCARLEKGMKEGEQRLYLMTMGILAVRCLAPITLSSLPEIIFWRFSHTARGA